LLRGNHFAAAGEREVHSQSEFVTTDPEDIDGVRGLVPVAVEPDLTPTVGEFAGWGGPFIEVIGHSMNRADPDSERCEQIR
jgi:hypothetical protein